MVIDFLALELIFVLYCALNANGYDKENNKEMHPVRLKARTYLSTQDFTKFDFKWNAFQYTKQVILSDNLKPGPDTNPDFIDSLNYLRKFKDGVKLSFLWPEVEKETKKVLNKYEDEALRMIKSFKELIDLEEPSNRIVISVNLLESYFRGFSITTPEATYLITGPADGVNKRNILHELLHAYLKKSKYGYIPNQDSYSRIPEELRKNYPIENIIEESTVRALVVYLGRRMKMEKIELSDQDRKLIFPEIILNKLTKLNSERITLDTLKSIERMQG